MIHTTHPQGKPTLFPEHKFKLAIGSKVQNPPPPPLPSSTLLQSKTQKAWPKPTTTTTPISSPPWSQTSNPTLATTLFSHGSGMPLSLSLSLSLWVALLMVLKSEIVWYFVYTEGLERWMIRYLRKFWTRSYHGFCRSARRPSF